VKRFGREELLSFLRAVDANLGRRTEVVVIGGAVAVIQYGLATGTHDIDTWTTVPLDLENAAARARVSTGYEVPLRHSGVADGPCDFESRLEQALPELQRLVVTTPERHDLALMKISRGVEHDMEAIEAVHRQAPLDLDILVTRYVEEMGAVIIDPIRLRGQFLSMIERLFPDELDRIQQSLPPFADDQTS